MLAGAQAHEPSATLVHPDMANGDALLFDGRTWHGSVNSQKRGRRIALLLQYATAASEVRIPDLNQLDWPFRIRSRPRPSVIVVSGSAREDTNVVVPPPSLRARGLPMITTVVHPLVLPLDSPGQQWQMFPAFHGPTTTLAEMSCHASVLRSGSPHPPHAHREEELLIPLEGVVNLITATDAADPTPRVTQVAPGSFVYYPAGQYHTIAPAGTSSVGYLMFKWYAAPIPGTDRKTLATRIVRYTDARGGDGSSPFHIDRVLEGPTALLGKVHAHVTTLQPGAAYDPHVDAYDVAILTVAGTVETLGQRVEARTVIYYAAGEPHGMRNVGPGVARYLVFEFHGPGTGALRADSPMHRRLASRALRIGGRVLRPAWRRLRGS
jgi:quercetin dioxygenase-like cupin family protein